MNGDYTILEKSMNGVKTLSDGISIISNGIATHENIFYTDFIKSQDEKTILLNDTITTENINVDNLNALDVVSNEVSTGILSCDYLYVNNVNNPLQDVFEVDGNMNKMKVYGQSEFRDVISIIDKNVSQTQGGSIQQTGTNFNTLKDTKINGFLEVGSNITQTGGSTILKDVGCDTITMGTNKGIAQNGVGVSNTLGTSTITNLTITGSVTFPSNVTIPATTTSDDIIMNGESVITQDITVSTTKFNKFRYTKTLNLDCDGNITQTKAGATATLKNTIIQGTSLLQGDIEQTAGFTKLNTIECNNITLRIDNDLNISGTGKITQTGTGVNQLNAISLNNNQNITFNGNGIISQPLNGTNILSNFRSAGFGIVAGRNNTTFGHYQNIQNNNGLQLQYNRDNSSSNSYFLNNRTGTGGGFRFQRYNGGVYVDEPMVIDDNITMNKNLNIAGGSLTCSSATIGIISQNELNCLDNCSTNIQVKFDNLDAQISSLETTTSGVTSNTTGITYNLSNDTTSVDNNLLLTDGKALILGTININSFITDTNTFINAVSNTLQGIVYTSGDDTTTLNNNVSVTGNLLVQGMNVKAEIDALETSFTTGTLNTTTLTAGTLNVSNHINMTNSNVANRFIYNLGGITFSDFNDGSYSMQMYNSSDNHYIISQRNNGIFTFLSVNADNQLRLMPKVYGNGSFNATTQSDDVLILGSGNAVGNQSLNLTVWSNTPTGVRVEPTKTIITGGDNSIDVGSSDNVTINATSNIKLNVLNENMIDVTNSLVKINSTFHIDNTAECVPNYIDDFSFPKTLSNNNNIINMGYITVSEFKKEITITTPISVYRQYRNVQTGAGFTNNIQDSLTGVSYTINKNGSFFSAGTCSLNNPTPKLIAITSSSNTNSRNYEVYMTNALFSFIPTFQKASAVYSIILIPTYSVDIPTQQSNIIIENFGYYANTAQSGTTVGLSLGSPGNSYLSVTYYFNEYGEKYLTGNGSIKLNEVFTNQIDNQFSINTNSLNVSTSITSSLLQTNNLYCSGNATFNCGIAAYHIDGTSNFLPTPIFCSMKSFGRSNSDNFWFLNSGFKLEIYNSNDYISLITTLDNTSSTTGTLFSLSDAERDRCESFRVFYLGNEISFPPLS